MKRYLFIIFLFYFSSLFAQDTLRVTTWNTLKFPEIVPQTRMPAMKIVIDAIKPDMLVVQELTSASGVDLLLDNVLNADSAGLWSAAPFTDGPDTDNILFYKSSKISLLSNRQIQSGLRDISEYVVKYKPVSSTPKLWIYSAHLKAGSSDRDITYRKRDAEIIREVLDQGPADACFMVMGDFNLYGSDEPAWSVLTGEGNSHNGRCYDPVNKPFIWHNSVTMSKYHTQSTRLTSVNEGASGGLDDRFDFILVSAAMMQPDGWQCLPESYQAFGNDGRHFNNYNINDNKNFVVADSIADALYMASDHLPVVTDIVYNQPTQVANETLAQPTDFIVHPAYPNPFNGGTTFSYNLASAGHVMADIYNIQGQHVETILSAQQQPGAYQLHWTPANLTSGVYFIRWNMGTAHAIQKLVYMK